MANKRKCEEMDGFNLNNEDWPPAKKLKNNTNNRREISDDGLFGFYQKQEQQKKKTIDLAIVKKICGGWNLDEDVNYGYCNHGSYYLNFNESHGAIYGTFLIGPLEGVIRLIKSNHACGAPAKRKPIVYDAGDIDDNLDYDPNNILEQETLRNDQKEDCLDEDPEALKKELSQVIVDLRWKKTYSFEWRGRETGEGELQLGNKKGTITFRDDGNSLEGVLVSDLGNFEFEAMKYSKVPPKRASSYDFDYDEEEQYYQESAARW